LTVNWSIQEETTTEEPSVFSISREVRGRKQPGGGAGLTSEVNKPLGVKRFDIPAGRREEVVHPRIVAITRRTAQKASAP